MKSITFVAADDAMCSKVKNPRVKQSGKARPRKAYEEGREGCNKRIRNAQSYLESRVAE